MYQRMTNEMRSFQLMGRQSWDIKARSSYPQSLTTTTIAMEMSKKRSVDGEISSKKEVKFEFTQNIFIVVSIFQNALYVHVRRYQDRYPTKDGVAMSPEEWMKVSILLTEDGDRKITTTTGKILLKRNKNKSATLTSISKGSTVCLTTITISEIKER